MKLKATLLFLIVLISTRVSAQIVINQNPSAAAIASAITGSGLTVTNVTIDCPSVSFGTYSNGLASGMNMSNGIVMTTGDAADLPGTGNFNDDFSSSSRGLFQAGSTDPQLVSVTGSSPVYDQCFIQFDVIPRCSELSIVFVFGSDEYTNWVNQSFNDGFGFFVSGPNPLGGNYTNYNIARLPNSTVVSIDNVNQTTNNGFFINNNTGTYANHFDGFTTVLSPVFNVVPCQSYHWKLAIGDAGDDGMDSGVLIDLVQCSSPLNATITTTPQNCSTLGTATATATGTGPFTYSWAPIGGNGATATNLPAGNYTVTVDDAISCQPPITYNVTIANTGTGPTMTTPASQTVCAGATVNVPGFTSSPAGATFNWSSSNAAIGLSPTSGAGTIPGFVATNGTGLPISSTITVTPSLAGCTGTPVSFTITVNPSVTPTFTAVGPYCSGAAIPALPTTSTNGVTGTWSPAINNTATTTYTFTPTAGLCALPVTTTITITPPAVPAFAAVGPYCSGAAIPALPTTSTNGITGTWSPAINNTATTTYTFTPTAGLCATTTTLSITVNPNVTPSFAAVGPYCSGAAIPALPATSTNGITGTWSPAINNTATTTYTFTPAAGQCATTTTLSVTINTQTVPAFAAVGPYCSGAAVPALPATSTNGITGTWSPAINNTATTTYTFTPAAGQCATTTTLSITINAQTVPAFAAVGPYCSGAAIPALPATSTNGITGTWSPAINNTATTTYTFTPAAGSCATTTTLSITINANTVPAFTNPGPLCSGTSFTLPAASNNGINGAWSPAVNNTATTTYTFTPSAGQCATTQTMTVVINPVIVPAFNALANICQNAAVPVLPGTSTNGINGTWLSATPSSATAGTFTFTFTPNAGQCASTTTLSLTVDPIITPTFAPIPNQCVAATPPALPGTSTNGITGTWNPSAINTSTAGSFNFTFTPSAGQCSSPVTITVTIGAQPVPAFAQIPAFCQNSTAPSLPTTSIDGVNGTWSPAAVSNSASGTYTFTPAPGVCAATTTMNITVNPEITTAFAPLNAVCQNTAAPNLLTTSTNGVTGTWSPASFSTVTAGTFTSTFTPNAGQCATTTTQSLTVNATPLMNVSPPATICQGGSTPLAASGATDYVWTPSATLSDNDVPNVTATPAATTTYTVTGTTNNCSASTTVTISVTTPTNTVFTTVGPFCSGATIAPFPTTSNNGVTGTWSPPVISNTTGASYTFTPDAGLCATQFINSIIITQPTQTQFPPIDPICEGELQPALPTQDLNGIAGTWSPAELSNMSSGAYVFTPASSACALPVTVNAVVSPNPVASFGMSDNELDITFTEVQFTNNSSNADTYNWEFGDGTSSDVVNPDHTYPAQPGGYTIVLTATNAAGCIDETSLTLKIKEDLFVFVPNSFTPDGDAYNNTFEAKITGDFDQYNFTMLIFDRWGEVLYETHDVNIGWDGTYGGKLVQEGVYTWKIDLKTKANDDKRVFLGSVTLMK